MSCPNLDDISDDTERLLRKNYEDNGFCFQTRLNLSDFVTQYFVNQDLERAVVCELVTQLLEKLNEQVQSMMKKRDTGLLTIRKTLRKTYDELKTKYSTSDDGKVKLYRIIVKCRIEEQQIISQQYEGTYVEVQEKMTQLKLDVFSIKEEQQRLYQDEQKKTTEAHLINDQINQFQQWRQQNGANIAANSQVQAKWNQLEVAKRNLDAKETDLACRKGGIISSFETISGQYDQLQNDILGTHLLQWRNEQRKNGYGDESKLKSIQKLCEDLAESNLLLKQILEQMVEWQPSNYEELKLNITTAFANLVTHTFVVVKQPPLVIRTGGKFQAEVASLVGSKIFGEAGTPSVMASLLPDEEIGKLERNEIDISFHIANEIKGGKFKCGVINNDVQLFESKRKTHAKFQNLQIKVGSVQRRKQLAIADELFSLVFRTQFTFCGFQHTLWTRTFPVVVITHDSQKMDALATVLWDNAAEPFHKNKELPWMQVFGALSRNWKQNCGEELGLENSYYLACKAFRENNLDYDQHSKMSIDSALIKKDDLPSTTKQISFWEWFHSMMVLTEDYLESLWKKGYVMGFVSKRRAEEMLAEKPEGTFLLRFSDSKLGGVTIGYRASDRIKWLAPFTKEELKMRGIIDMIYDLNHLTTLYPNIPKDNLERKSSVAASDGYVSVKLVAQIPDYVTPSVSVPAQNPDEPDIPLVDMDEVSDFLANILQEGTNIALPPDSDFDSDLFDKL